MVDTDPLKDIKVGIKGRLLGFKLVERGRRHVVLRMPWWANEQITQAAAERSQIELELTDEGRNVKVTRAGRLIRIDV